MASFTPVSAAIGGALIGLSAVLLMGLTGRIAGVSGILASIPTGAGGRGWRIASVAGLILAAPLLALAGIDVPAPTLPASWAVVIAGGLLVGFGARLGGGCTSGHGICGIARLSLRSLTATAVFMTTAIVVVALGRHVLGG